MALEKQTITLMGEMQLKEAAALAETFPGQLVTIDANGKAIVQTGKVQPRIAVAVEGDMHGRTIEQSYAAGENLLYKIPRRGDEMNLRVATNAAAIAFGDPLAVDTAGKVKVHGGDFAAETVIGYAKEAVTNVSGSDVFISVEIA